MTDSSHNLKDVYRAPNVQKRKKSMPEKIVLKIIIYVLLILSAPFSYVFPMIGFPIGVLLMFNTKRHYAVFPFAGVAFLVFSQILGYLTILLTT